MAQTVVDLVVKTSGLAKLAQVDKALKGIGAQAVKTGAGVDRMAKAVGSVTGAGLNRLAAGFDRVKASADRAAASTKKAISAAAKSNAAKGIAAAGAFSGLPGAGIAQAIGAGGLAGGPVGAATAGITAVGIAAIDAGGKAAAFAAEISKLEVALKNVAGPDTTQALDAIRAVVDDFNTPIKEATEGFTGLAAATSAAGFSIDETEQVYRSLAAANKALGGDVTKLNGILLAAQQVFSKGKVSAEELRGQIGERLPGAFAEFAAATGRTTQELDKALNDGEVSLEDFVKFSERLLLKYEEDAKKIASGPEEAGARLQTALSDLQRNIGALLQPIGAAFQNTFTAIIKIINGAIVALNKFLGIGTANAIAKVEGQIAEAEGRLGKNDGRNDDRVNKRLRVLKSELGVLKERQKVEDASLKSNAPKPAPVPTLTSGGGSSGGGSSAIDTLSQQMKAGEALAQQFERQRQLRLAENELSKALLQNEFKRQDIVQRIYDTAAASQQEGLVALANSEAQAVAEQLKSDAAEKQLKAYQDIIGPLEAERDLLEASLSGDEDRVKLQQKINAAIEGRTPAEAAYIEQVIRGNAALQDRLEKQQALKEQVQQLSGSIASEFTSAISSVIEGSPRLSSKRLAICCRTSAKHSLIWLCKLFSNKSR